MVTPFEAMLVLMLTVFEDAVPLIRDVWLPVPTAAVAVIAPEIDFVWDVAPTSEAPEKIPLKAPLPPREVSLSPVMTQLKLSLPISEDEKMTTCPVEAP
jgi:hypothetical protein